MIETRELSKRFDGRTVLDAVNIHIKEGEIVGIIGRGGGGKSVLLKLICGLQNPDEGSLRCRHYKPGG